MPRLGTRKLQYMLQEQGVKVSRDKLFDLLREHRMLVRRRKKYAITTNSRHWMKKYPNLIRGFCFQRPNQLWVSDITYISINDSFAYLSLVTDAFSRKILGHYLYLNLAADGTAQALKMALADAGSDLSGLIHHSQRHAILLQRLCRIAAIGQYPHQHDREWRPLRKCPGRTCERNPQGRMAGS